MAEVASSTPEKDSAGGHGEDYSRAFDPIVKLSKVETKTGEEDEDVFFKIRAKLFRFSKELNEWKERGTGECRILQHKESDKFRLLMRRDKTLKICLNHYVSKSVVLHENMGSDRSWVWTAVDYADGERDECSLAIRFANSNNAQKFKKAYDIARDFMEKKSKGLNPERPKPMVLEEDAGAGAGGKRDAGEKKPKSSMAAALEESERLKAATETTTEPTQTTEAATKTHKPEEAPVTKSES